MEYIIAIILLVIAFLITGFIVKKKYFKEVDRLEAWKIELLNRPVLDELARIKRLKMSGQAEELFEKWRQTWDSIVTADLPDVEDMLFDAEEYIEKYRFSKAKSILHKIESILKETEGRIEKMVEELNDLIGSEEMNRTDIDLLSEQYKELKKSILAHRHVYCKAANAIEKKLNEMETLFANFEEETENGNYFQAREHVLTLREKIQALQEKMDVIPHLLNECLHKIPIQLKEISDGTAEMKSQGYFLEHIGIEKELSRMEKQLEAYVNFIENLETEEVSKGIEDMNESINLLFDLLENEVKARSFVKEYSHRTKEKLLNLVKENKRLKEETNVVLLSYQLKEEELNIQRQIEKKLDSIRSSLEILDLDNGNISTAYSSIQEKLTNIINDLEKVEEEQKEYAQMLAALRKDELAARDRIQVLKQKVNEIKIQVQRSNIPGIPSEAEMLFFETSEKIMDVFQQLELKPLNMHGVQRALLAAEEKVTQLHDSMNEMIENVYLIEKIIQYGNRYRRTNPTLHEKLLSAEEAFRRYDYQLALEEAASAVEEVESGALKKIEDWINGHK